MISVAVEWNELLGRLAQALRRRRAQARRQDELRILALVPEGPSRTALQEIARLAGWALTVSDGAHEPKAVREPSIVIYDRELSPQHWRQMLRQFANKSPRPYIILFSTTADANLWEEVQRAGGSDIVRTPVVRDDLAGALSKAWQLWRIHQKLRQPPAFRK